MTLDRDRGSSARIFKLLWKMKPSSSIALLNYLEQSNIVITYAPAEKGNYTLHIVSRKNGMLSGRISIPVHLEGAVTLEKLILAMKEQYEHFFSKVKNDTSHS